MKSTAVDECLSSMNQQFCSRENQLLQLLQQNEKSMSMREFYRSIKAMRLQDEPFSPTTAINDKEGNPLYNEEEIKNKIKMAGVL